jgi:hypothetical protein
MKFNTITIALCLLFPALMAQDPTPAVEPQDTIPAVAPAVEPQDTVAAAAPVAAPAEEPAEQPKEQPAEKPSWKTKIYYGGYVNFTIGSYTSIGIEPMIGYKIIPRLSIGLKIKYDYVQDNRYATEYSYSNYGGSLFARLSVIKQIYLHAEYAGYNYERYEQLDGSSSRVWVPYLFLGAGFRQPLGGRASLNAQVLFDVLNNANSPYRSYEPFYSVGVSVGF